MIKWTSIQGQALAIILFAIGYSLLLLVGDLTFANNVIRWVILIVLGLPLYLYGEWVGEKLFSPVTGERISSKAFSWKRIIYGLFIFLVTFGLAYGIYYQLKGALR